MRKTLLFVSLLVTTVLVFQVRAENKVWNVGNDPVNFPVSAGIGAGPDVSVYVDGLGIHTGTVTNVNMGQVESGSKSFVSSTLGNLSFANRFKFNGGGYPQAAVGDNLPSVFTPTQRYLTIAVSGNSTIYAIGITGSNNTDRNLFVTDGEKLIGTMGFGGKDLMDFTVEYTGPATTLYLYCNAAINLYYLSATNVVVSSVQNPMADQGIFFNGTDLVNHKQLPLTVFDILGKQLVSSSNANIALSNLKQGVYFVKTEGVNGTLKFRK